MQRISTLLTVTVTVAATALSAAPATQAAPATLDKQQLVPPGKAHAKGQARLGRLPARAEQIGRRDKPRAPKTRARYRLASCVDWDGLTGTWLNYGRHPRSVTRVVVRFACGDKIHCDSDGVCTSDYTGYVVEVFGAERESWGREIAPAAPGGWYRAIYPLDGTRHVWLAAESHGGRTFLRVSVWIDRPDWDVRADVTSSELFLR